MADYEDLAILPRVNGWSLVAAAMIAHGPVVSGSAAAVEGWSAGMNRPRAEMTVA